MVLKLKIYPDKILRQSAAEIKFPATPEIKKLISDMLDTVRDSKGIGLAAPQVGKSLRVVIINLEHLGVPAFALINPVVTKFHKKRSGMEEGCLSIPGVFGIVDRPEKIEFTAHDIKGKKIEAEADGLMARVIQHEIDHINGVLIIDKIKRYIEGKELVK